MLRFMAGAPGAAAAAGLWSRLSGQPRAASAETAGAGRLNHSVCHWCFNSHYTVEEMCEVAKPMGITSVELLGPNHWDTVRDHGMVCAMASGPGGIENGWNDPAMHEELIAESERLLPMIAEYGWPNMIVFSGNRRDLSDEEGLENCVRGLEQIVPLAEEVGVTVCIELLNSRRTHPDYMCDRTPWGVELVDRIGSDRFKLLYDIFHLQIMEGDIIQTIRDYHEHIGHYHTGGVPGRNEIDETQELNYRAIAEAIADTGFEGYVGQEFIPTGDPAESLQAAIDICNV